MSAPLVLISPAGTGGWRRNERALSESLTRLGTAHQVVAAAPSQGRRALAVWPAGALIVAAAGRRAAAEALRGGAGSLLMVNSTSALLLPWRRLERLGVPVAIRIDSPATALWPGRAHALTHRLERRALSRAAIAIATGQRSAELVAPLAKRVAVAPVPVDTGPAAGAAGAAGERPAVAKTVLAYAGQPHERGLDRLAAAWRLAAAREPSAELVVTAVTAPEARRYLAGRGVSEPPRVRWAGELAPADYATALASAAAFASVPRMEGHGIAALEALAAGVPLVTAPARGAHEAEPLARRLAPDLVAEKAEPEAIASAIGAALRLNEQERRSYAERAADAVSAHSERAADAGVAEALAALGLSAAA